MADTPEPAAVPDPRSFDERLAAAERDHHDLWTSEPDVPLDRRRELLDELADVESELSAIALAAMTGDAPDDSSELTRRLGGLQTRLAALGGAWRPTAA